MSSARTEMLNRIRSALRDVPPGETPDMVRVERDYLRRDSAPHEALIEQFIDRLVDYKALVKQVAPDALPAAIADSCAARGVRRLVVPRDAPAAWLPAGIAVLRDEALTKEALDSSDGVLTGCALGVAQTGTIVLDSGVAQGRRALTLIPDYHLCVVRAEQIVGLMPEAVAQLDDAVRQHRRPLTFISGPSATSDIELSRVEGVHGPRTLEVIIVGAEGNQARGDAAR